MHLGIAQVQRRKAEAQDIRGAKVADDAARDQRLHDRVGLIAVGQRKAGLAAAFVAGRRGQQGQAMRIAARGNGIDEQVDQRTGFVVQDLHAVLAHCRRHDVDTALQRNHG